MVPRPALADLLSRVQPADLAGTSNRRRPDRRRSVHTPGYIRAAAEILYTTTLFPVEEIAAQVQLSYPHNPVTPEKVARWADKGRWPRPKRSVTVSGLRVVARRVVVEEPVAEWRSWMA